ncbi:MAG: putative Se/S carrier-like protein [Fusobacteriaceae bacterium]
MKASCGLSIKLQEENLEIALNILKSKDIHMEIYSVEKKGLQKKIDFLSSF